MNQDCITLYSSSIHTPLGEIIALADSKSLYMLQFADHAGVKKIMQRISAYIRAPIIKEESAPITMIRKELDAYFNHTLQKFKTPYTLLGTTFQKHVWHSLASIPYGYSTSYRNQATSINKPSAYRAVANANGANPLVIVLPCHRVRAHNGQLGGYNSGIQRKKWLLNHEEITI